VNFVGETWLEGYPSAKFIEPLSCAGITLVR
jgi:hypothetical protein